MADIHTKPISPGKPTHIMIGSINSAKCSIQPISSIRRTISKTGTIILIKLQKIIQTSAIQSLNLSPESNLLVDRYILIPFNY